MHPTILAHFILFLSWLIKISSFSLTRMSMYTHSPLLHLEGALVNPHHAASGLIGSNVDISQHSSCLGYRKIRHMDNKLKCVII